MLALATSEAFLHGAHLDEPRFMEGRSAGLAVEEEVVRAPPPGCAVKLMLFVGLAAGATRDAATPLWPTAHAAGHVRNRAVAGAPADMAAAFDLVEEIWWRDPAAYAADRAAAPPLAAIGWIDPLRTRAAFAEELIVIPPPR